MQNRNNEDSGTGATWQSGAGGGTRGGSSSSAKEGPQFSTDFYMYCYKILPCAKRHSHDWASCPYAHSGEKACRRDPRRFNYQPAPCPANSLGAACPRGAACPFAHNLYECWLHPNRFCTQFCQKGAECTRPLCFFAHSIDELRFPEQQPMEPTVQMGPTAAVAALSGVSGEADALAQQLMGQAALGVNSVNIGVPDIAGLLEGAALAPPVAALAGSSLAAGAAPAGLGGVGAVDVGALAGPSGLLHNSSDAGTNGFGPVVRSRLGSGGVAGGRLPVGAGALVAPLEQQLAAMELSGGLRGMPMAHPGPHQGYGHQGYGGRRSSNAEQQRLATLLGTARAAEQDMGGGSVLLHGAQQPLPLAHLALLHAAQQQPMQQQQQQPMQQGAAGGRADGRSMMAPRGMPSAVAAPGIGWPAGWQEQARGGVLSGGMVHAQQAGNGSAAGGRSYQDSRQLTHDASVTMLMLQQQQQQAQAQAQQQQQQQQHYHYHQQQLVQQQQQAQQQQAQQQQQQQQQQQLQHKEQYYQGQHLHQHMPPLVQQQQGQLQLQQQGPQVPGLLQPRLPGLLQPSSPLALTADFRAGGS